MAGQIISMANTTIPTFRTKTAQPNIVFADKPIVKNSGPLPDKKKAKTAPKNPVSKGRPKVSGSRTNAATRAANKAAILARQGKTITKEVSPKINPIAESIGDSPLRQVGKVIEGETGGKLKKYAGKLVKKIPGAEAVITVGKDSVSIVGNTINFAKDPSLENAHKLVTSGGPAAGLSSLIDEGVELATGVKVATAVSSAKRKRSRPCPYDDGEASDGSKCGGRSAQSRGKTTGYDTPEGFFERF